MPACNWSLQSDSGVRFYCRRAELFSDGRNDLRVQSFGRAGEHNTLFNPDVFLIEALELAGRIGELFRTLPCAQ